MATNTYVALDKVTVGTATNTITFTGINQGYTDLVLVGAFSCSAATGTAFRFNGDSGSNYSYTGLEGNGSSAFSGRNSNATNTGWTYDTTANGQVNGIAYFNNYSNTTTYKTLLTRFNTPATQTGTSVNLWRNTSAITSITLTAGSGNFNIGSTFSLYGIAAASVGAKATGGTIYSDDTYYYHVFGSTGTFTPLQSLSVDSLVIAGGGGAGGTIGGGGGAGGLTYYASQSLTATGYTVTVGGGGAGTPANTDAKGSNGSNSQFAALTASVGGGGGGDYGTSGIAPGANGGSGGGASGYDGGPWNGGTATSGQGFAGGTGNTSAAGFAAGGGGGAGGAGVNGNVSGGSGTAVAGNGGIGSNTYATWLTATGFGVNGYIAAGGGGGLLSGATVGTGGTGGGGNGSSTGNGSAALANSGSGGGGGAYAYGYSGGNGGSGLVIVRYAKA